MQEDPSKYWSVCANTREYEHIRTVMGNSEQPLVEEEQPVAEEQHKVEIKEERPLAENKDN